MEQSNPIRDRHEFIPQVEQLYPQSELNEFALNDHLPYEYRVSNIPMVRTIGFSTFPKQDETKIGTVAERFYIDEYIHKRSQAWFRVVRWDLEEPHRVILVSDANQIILVSTVEQAEMRKYVHTFPIQDNAYLGLHTIDKYYGTEFDYYNAGLVLRCDIGDCGNPQVVILEDIDDNTYRLVTLEETRAICQPSDIVYKDKKYHDKWDWYPKDWRNLK